MFKMIRVLVLTALFVFLCGVVSAEEEGRYKIYTHEVSVNGLNRVVTMKLDKETGRTWKLVSINGYNSWRDMGGGSITTTVYKDRDSLDNFRSHSERSKRRLGTGRRCRPFGVRD